MAAANSMQDLNVLVVDDDREIVNVIEIYLKNEGLNVLKAYDGIQAIQQLRENEIHLILMDIMMPKLDGIQTTLKIREQNQIPIILVSAKGEDTDKIIGLNLGADDYIARSASGTTCSSATDWSSTTPPKRCWWTANRCG